jgi:hypothetical protein
MRRKRFELIHRQALFQYLRDSPIAGAEREAIMAAFHGTSDYRRAVVAEHGRFLQSNSSLFCAEHLASSIMQDARFGRGLETYRRRYMSFFSHFCGSILAESQGREFAARQVIPALKKELLVLRRDLLSLPVVTAATGWDRLPGH